MSAMLDNRYLLSERLLLQNPISKIINTNILENPAIMSGLALLTCFF